jgi:hypothetical protein
VEQAEQEKLVEELESRVERLRALYDQFFMGIERLEPLILRKDVDRRLWVLWREQIHNTGLRFRMHMVVQRYNTFQQYWQRICREIESGTYTRDVRRAAEKFGEEAALTAMGRRRKKMFEKGLAKRAERDAARGKGGAPAPGPGAAPPVGAAAAPKSAPGSGTATAPASSRPPPSRPAIALPATARRAPARRAAPETFEPLELDMLSDFVGEGGDLRAARLPSIDVPAVAAPTPAGAPDDEPDAPTLPPPPRPEALALAKQAPAARPGGGAGGRPVQPGAAAARPPAAQPVAVAGAADDDLPATRLRQIYGQYVDAKRRCNESTASLTFDKISKDLRDTAQRLRQKHAGKKIDFEIVLKNGTPVLRPVIKG